VEKGKKDRNFDISKIEIRSLNRNWSDVRGSFENNSKARTATKIAQLEERKRERGQKKERTKERKKERKKEKDES
jgi:hypothetical protein